MAPLCKVLYQRYNTIRQLGNHLKKTLPAEGISFSHYSFKITCNTKTIPVRSKPRFLTNKKVTYVQEMDMGFLPCCTRIVVHWRCDTSFYIPTTSYYFVFRAFQLYLLQAMYPILLPACCCGTHRWFWWLSTGFKSWKWLFRPLCPFLPACTQYQIDRYLSMGYNLTSPEMSIGLCSEVWVFGICTTGSDVVYL